MRKRPEEQIHRAIADYLRFVAPIHKFWWCHVPNGGARSKAEAGIFKALGVKAGVPDILIIKNRRAYWLEIKGPKGSLSNNQAITRLELETEQNCPWALVRSVDEADTKLKEWGIVGLTTREMDEVA